jgi:hypothetical protein
MAIMPVPAEDAQRYYRVGALGLRALQDRGLGAKRFSADAIARWRAFKGELTDSQRLDLLLRDGAATYPLAFAAREVFRLEGLADDEPFGPAWASLAPSKAGPILRDAESSSALRADAPVQDVLSALADIWGLRVGLPDSAALEKVGAASRLVVAGAGALVALGAIMAGRTDTDFGDQILLVTSQPGLRQLAGLAAALTGSRRAPRWLLPGLPVAAATAMGFTRATGMMISSDAAELEAAAAAALASELGA